MADVIHHRLVVRQRSGGVGQRHHVVDLLTAIQQIMIIADDTIIQRFSAFARLIHHSGQVSQIAGFRPFRPFTRLYKIQIRNSQPFCLKDVLHRARKHRVKLILHLNAGLVGECLGSVSQPGFLQAVQLGLDNNIFTGESCTAARSIATGQRANQQHRNRHYSN